jgi:phospholipid/cholesterol/gamma-HCH transport system substrate-binding protein
VLRLPRFEDRGSRRVLGVLLIGAVLALIVIATVRPAPFRDTNTYWVEFDSAQGLGRVDRDVRAAGTNVGDIGEVRRVGDDVVMEMTVDDDVPVHADARANLRPHTLFEGSAFIDLHPGSPSAPLMPEGGTIPQSRTQVYVSVDEALRVLHKPSRDALRDLADTGAKTLRGEAIGGLQRTLRNSDELLRDLGPTAQALRGPRGDELAGAIQGLSRTIGAVGSREADLAPLVSNARRTLAALGVDAGEPLDEELAAAPGVLEELDEGSERLVQVIDRLDQLSVDLRPAMLELAPLLRELRPLLERGTPVTRDALPLVVDLRTVIDRVVGVAPQLHELLVAMEPGAKLLQESVLPSLNAESRLGQPTYMQLVSALTAATSALRPYQTDAQGLLGPGHVLRLGAYLDSEFLAKPPLPLPFSAESENAGASCGRLGLGVARIARELESIGACER